MASPAGCKVACACKLLRPTLYALHCWRAVLQTPVALSDRHVDSAHSLLYLLHRAS